MPARRQPVVTSRIAADDIVLVADGTGVYYGLVRGRTPAGGFFVSPLHQLTARRRVRPDDIADHWARAERGAAVSAMQLQLGLPEA